MAGFRFETPPPEVLDKLPRMDIAAFVGFAASGPLHRPVAVEDPSYFRDIFGADLPLAWDSVHESVQYAHLGPAVRGFFRNGGRRCWVIRVAEDRPPSYFPLAGMVRRSGDSFEAAFARARSSGSGFDATRAAMALSADPIEAAGMDLARFSWLDVRLPRRGAAIPGDLLRLTFAGADAQLYFAVDKIAGGEASEGRARPRLQRLTGRPVAWARPLRAGDFGREPVRVIWRLLPAHGELPAQDLVLDGETFGARTSPLGSGRQAGFGLEMPSGVQPPIGTTLECVVGARRFWLMVESLQFGAAQGGSPLERRTRVFGRAFELHASSPSRPPDGRLPRIERLSFEIHARSQAEDAQRMERLGFTREHPRCWNHAPDDSALFAFPEFRRSLEAVKAEAREGLWRDALEPKRFPLAGDRDDPGVLLPIGLGTVLGPFMSRCLTDRTALERNGLDRFDASLFLDPGLSAAGMNSLITEAEFLRYQSPRPRRLTGIHAALEIEEATLIAAPDAVHAGWHRRAGEESLSPLSGTPLPRPDRELNGVRGEAASPPNADARGWDGFLHCEARVLQPPALDLAEPPDLSGTFTLRWTSSDLDAEFELEESRRSDFGGGAEVWRGSGNSMTLRGREPGAYFFRVRSEKGGATSHWSMGLRVSVPQSEEWELNSLGAFSPQTMLDAQRAMMRLCAARGDLLALLALPEHFREEASLEYLTQLTSSEEIEPANGATQVLPLGGGEAQALSHGAVFHPWLAVREDASETLRRTPPEGAIAGLIARRALERGAWIAPANVAIRDAAALVYPGEPERREDLLIAQLNLIRREPGGFLTLNADTLSPDPDLRPINVRRLLSMLRRAALRQGLEYAFESNGPGLRRLVRHDFEALLDQLFVRGAFAGATRSASFQVLAEDGVGAERESEQGRFRVDLKVAPARPMAFVTVRLDQAGERGLATELY